MIVALGVLIAAIWMLALYDTIQEEHEKRYNVTVRPGAVSYGTHSTASVPPLALPMQRSSAPMISGGMVRSYAHHGHATMPSAGVSSGYRMHATSSASVKTIGSGSGSGAGMGTASGTSSTSRGITYSGGSVSMPVLAVASSSFASSSSLSEATTSSSARYGIGPRRARPTGSGTDGEWSDNGEGDGDWYYYDDWTGDWIEPWEGATRPAEGGNYWKYTDGAWVLVNDQGDPVNPQPLGATPWLLMILLTCVYALGKNYVSYSKYEKIS